MKSTILTVALLAVLGAAGCSDDDKPAGSAAIEAVNEFPAAIPDNSSATPLYSEINIEASGRIARPELVSITLNLEHTFAGDVIVELIAPNGQSMTLIKRLGLTDISGYGLGANYVAGNLIVMNSSHEMTLPVAGLSTNDAIPGGNYRPTGSDTASPTGLLMVDMATFLEGKSINGNWRLRLSDYSQADTGSLIAWKMNFAAGALD